ncbi:hypothetical protein A4X13_0g7312 [Tilletia indica]|uniref:Uncharacterized protein n=1 Tax=Tilletia indica TaxID=43049 RepID=A0A177TD88_9BASI|nr:hypothetical protein A4X13_0g7312 [Tilletia indica]
MAKRKSTGPVAAAESSSARRKSKTAKTSKHSKNEKALSAVNRFVRVTELVEIVIAYLARDRIDLITVASVCKHLRVPALRMWVRYLDVPLSSAHNRLSFFEANPELLREVRFIRIHNDLVEFQCDTMKNFYPAERQLHWAELKELFTLMAAQLGPTYSRVPAFDITIADTDAQAMTDSLSASSDLVGNVVALRIIPQFVLSTSGAVQTDSSEQLSGDEVDSDGTDGDGDASGSSSESDVEETDEVQDIESEEEQQDSEIEDPYAIPSGSSNSIEDFYSATLKLIAVSVRLLEERMIELESTASEGDSEVESDVHMLDNLDLTDSATVSDDTGDDSDGDSDSASIDPEIAAERRAEAWSNDWDTLSAFVTNVQKESTRLSKPGLLVFHYGCKQSDYEKSGGWEHELPASFWVALGDSAAANLLDLAISPPPDDHRYSRVLDFEFAKLRSFNITHECDESVQILGTFLDAHTGLEDLTLDTMDSRSLGDTLRQTFPRLRRLHTSKYIPRRPQQTLDFVQRHPELSSLTGARLVNVAARHKPAANTKLFPNLRYLSTSSTKVLSPYARRGGRPCHLRIMNEDDVSDELRIHDLAEDSWLSRNPETAKAITCLEISQHIHSSEFLPHLHSAFTSDFLPNLTELCISFEKEDKSYIGQDLDLEEDVGRIFEALVPARSLQVLRLCDQSVPFDHKEILVGNIFPPALELFGWLEPPLQRPQYFRFLPDSSSKPSSSAKSAGKTTESVGKRGRLEWIPSCFRAKVTSEGVWERPLDGSRAGTILDHTGDKPTTVLS